MGFFSNLFKDKTENSLIDLSFLGCDMHSHFIPNIDDGAQSIEDSLDLVKGLYNLGYRKIITTPHIMSDTFRNTPEIILSGLEILRAAVKKESIEIEINAAAEYYVDFEFEKKIGNEPLLTFGDNYVLFEVSYMNPAENLNSIIFKLQTNGYKPVLAHPERYNYWHSDFDKYLELKDKGVLLQMNLNSLSGHYSLSTKKIAERMIDANIIDFAGTDCHHLGHIDLLNHLLTNKHLKKLIDSNRLRNRNL